MVWSNVALDDIPVVDHHQLGGDQSNIIQSGYRLGMLASGATDANAGFQELTANSITIRCTIESTTQGTDKNGNTIWLPNYFAVGFQQTLASSGSTSTLTKLPYQSAELLNLIDSNDRDTIFISRPQWQLMSIDGSVVNQADLENAAQTEAPNFVKDSGNPMRIIRGAGFLDGGMSPNLLNGTISEVQWNQEDLTTQWKLNTWYAPVSGILNLKDHTALAESFTAFPNQHATATARTALGVSGATQPTTLIQSAKQPDAASGQLFTWCNLYKTGGADGGVTGTVGFAPSYIYTAVNTLTGITLASGLTMTCEYYTGSGVVPATVGLIVQIGSNTTLICGNETQGSYTKC
jgi:hypothetical protein